MPSREIVVIVGSAAAVTAPVLGAVAGATAAHAATPRPAPHPAAAIPEGCGMTLREAPYKYGGGNQVLGEFTSGGYCAGGPATVRLFESPDRVHWKTVTTSHQDGLYEFVTYVSGNCSPGTNYYLAGFLPDDHSFKSSSPVVTFTC
jgi:hypothetical protein